MKAYLSLMIAFVIAVSQAYGNSQKRIVGDSIVEPGDHTRTIMSGGFLRSYIVHVPKKYTDTKKVSLVVVLHGGGSNAADWIKFCGLNETSEKNGFIVVYPNGSGHLKGYESKVLGWNGGPHEPGGTNGFIDKIDDVSFIAMMLDALEASLKIDKNRVYAVGMSMGGIMAYRLASELSGRIAAIASISGPMGTDSCHPQRPVSVIHFHGTEDNAVPFNGGVGSLDPSKTVFYSADYSIQSWVKANGCDKNPKVEKLPNTTNDSTTVIRNTYSHGREKSEVVLYVIEGGGHAWPGRPFGPELKILGRSTKNISANEVLWEFFVKHPIIHRHDK